MSVMIMAMGYAAEQCKKSLVLLGHEVAWRDPIADIEINFIQPNNWYWSGVDYRIGYLPWESTGFHDGWVDRINDDCDEIWTPSPLIAEWMVDAGVKKQPKIYQHGVESVWEAIQRPATGTYHILHHGAEALRKGGQETIDAFIDKMWDLDAILTLKMQLQNANYIDSDHIWIRKNKVSLKELVKLYQDNELLCHPSWGEGFGLPPLQAMATGMPVLVTRGWAPYQHLIPDECLIASELVESPWQSIHPGKMFKPDLVDLRDKLIYCMDNRERLAKQAFATAQTVHDEYNWLDLTRAAFSHLFV